MMHYLLPILAVIIGGALVMITREKTHFNFKLLLAFSGAFLLALTLFELLPEVYDHLNPKQTGLFIMLGILIQIILEFFSKGAEHGHVHAHATQADFPWALFISLSLHSFLEGFPIHQHNDMVYGVLIHKIPIATVITSFLIHSKASKLQVISFLMIFAAMTPIGTYISNHMDISETYISGINAIVIGIFLHISTTILFESSEGHKFNLTKLVAIVLGVATAYLI
ncbi:ZIP family metal transporter [Bizionia sp. KMM 8389]